MHAADTNLLIRLITRDDARQVVTAEAFVQKGAWISLLVLAEAAWVLTSVYGLGRTELAVTVDMLLQHRELTLQQPEVVTAALQRFREKSGVSFSDCLILEIARKSGHTPLGTFDRPLGRLDGAETLKARD